ncbi:MAG: helicase [Candidatus Aenigmatarchaeota archaeon]|nr:MAG: helicase [Candidatus Aenigmarchaeota archaeon]
MVWGNLSREIRNALKERGFKKPTLAQIESFEHIVSNRNTLLIAPTGVGKTEAVLLPVFDRFLRERERLKPISILYITPLRSLNRDMLSRILWWSERLGFEVSVRHGDTGRYERGMQAANPADMFIITPETLQAMLVGKQLRKHLANVKWVIIDEVHELVGNKRGAQLAIGLERLKMLAGDFQIIGISATIRDKQEVAKFISPNKDCVIVDVTEKKRVCVSVISTSDGKSDVEIIERLVARHNSVLIFTNTREQAEFLSARLRTLSQFPIETHHSSLSRDVRVAGERLFKEGKIKALVCTSSLELGIDIGSVDLVIQYFSPRQVSKFLQRSGRSGHKVEMVSKGVIITKHGDDCFESAAIAGLAKKNMLEPTIIYKKAMDVLMHQIAGLLMEYSKLSVRKVWDVVKHAYPYNDIKIEEVMDVCSFMREVRLISMFEEGKEAWIRARRGLWKYYYENLSTIPDTKTYKVVDIVSGKEVATLDEEFVNIYCLPNARFIVKGQAWRVVDVREQSVMVEPYTGREASIPAWIGELIPVHANVAMEVGKIRRLLGKWIAEEKDKEDMYRYMKEHYSIDIHAFNSMLDIMKRQVKYSFIPDEQAVYIEGEGDYVVIHSCNGSMVNEALGKIIAFLLTPKIGSVVMESDPYRIILRLQRGNEEMVAEVLKSVDLSIVKQLLAMHMKNSELFMWRFTHVAKRMGIIKRDASYGKGYIRKLVDVYQSDIPFKETLNEIFTEKMDVEGAMEIIKKIRCGQMGIFVKKGLSPLATIGIEARFELVTTPSMESEIFDVFKKRIMDTKLMLVCFNCARYIEHVIARDVPQDIKCPKCGAKLIGIVKPWEEEKVKVLEKYLRGKKLNKEEDRMLTELLESATLTITYGKQAVIAMAGRGVGVATAKRILAKMKSGDELIMEIMRAEREYVRTKRYWEIERYET